MSEDTTEEWRQVPGYEGHYDVSNLGRVRSYKKWRAAEIPRLMAVTTAHHGYKSVVLTLDGIQTAYKIHRLVLVTFVGPRPDGLEIRHLDGDPSNNHLNNLRYGTSLENHEDQRMHGTLFATHCFRGHELAGSNLYVSPFNGNRGCRACGRIRAANKRARRRSAADISP